MSLKNTIFKHYKGKYYRVLCTAINTETEIPMVVYQQLYSHHIYPEGFIWCRPEIMFHEKIVINDVEIKRFTQVDDYPTEITDVLERLS